MATPYTVRRETTVPAPAPVVHALVDDFHAWPRWSPWEDLDPGMERTYGGSESGVDAHYAWSGNRQAGAGEMEIVESDPGRVAIDLAFSRPFPSRSRVEFLLHPEGDATRVEWLMSGELNLLMRLFSVVKPMDSLVGPDMEKGLTRLSAAAQEDARTA